MAMAVKEQRKDLFAMLAVITTVSVGVTIVATEAARFLLMLARLH